MTPTGLNKTIGCELPKQVYIALKTSNTPFLQTIRDALIKGLDQFIPDRPMEGFWWKHTWVIAPVTVPSSNINRLFDIANNYFDNDHKKAAGWLIAQGVGLNLPLPTARELMDKPTIKPIINNQPPPEPEPVLEPVQKPTFELKPTNTTQPEIQTILSDGVGIKSRREALGLRQRKFAVLANRSRSLISATENGLRSHLATLTYLSQVLSELEAESHTT